MGQQCKKVQVPLQDVVRLLALVRP